MQPPSRGDAEPMEHDDDNGLPIYRSAGLGGSCDEFNEPFQAPPEAVPIQRQRADRGAGC